MDLAISDLRAHLSEWLERVRAGDELVITDRGSPVARLTGIGNATRFQKLVAAGVISRPQQVRRPAASGRPRPKSRRLVSDIVSEQRSASSASIACITVKETTRWRP